MRHLASKLFRPTNVLPFGQQKPNAEATTTAALSKSAKLLEDQGLVRQTSPGMFAYLPLGLRSLNKLTQLVDSCMAAVGGQKILLPALTPGADWVKTERRDLMGKELLTLNDRHRTEFILSPTHEEAITTMIANVSPLSPRTLPLRLYQISPKYRDEMRPRYGLIRGREFIMKDLYTFDLSVKDAKIAYEVLSSAYVSFFDQLGVPYVCVEGDSGSMGGELSHEYHFIGASIGEDRLKLCSQCSRGVSSEVSEAKFKDCPTCGGNVSLKEQRGIEVGHTFLLGHRYSSALGATFHNDQGKLESLQMGCYGIGLSRVMAASTEVLSTESELRWPSAIVPFTAIVLGPKKGSKEWNAQPEAAGELCDKLEHHVFQNDVLYDDRGDITVGKKLREAKKMGYPVIVLFGKDSLPEKGGLLEVHTLADQDYTVQKLTSIELFELLVSSKT